MTPQITGRGRPCCDQVEWVPGRVGEGVPPFVLPQDRRAGLPPASSRAQDRVLADPGAPLRLGLVRPARRDVVRCAACRPIRQPSTVVSVIQSSATWTCSHPASPVKKPRQGRKVGGVEDDGLESADHVFHRGPRRRRILVDSSGTAGPASLPQGVPATGSRSGRRAWTALRRGAGDPSRPAAPGWCLRRSG